MIISRSASDHLPPAMRGRKRIEERKVEGKGLDDKGKRRGGEGRGRRRRKDGRDAREEWVDKREERRG